MIVLNALNSALGQCHHCSRVTDAESRSQATRPLHRQHAIMAGPLSRLIRQSHFPAAFPAGGGANATGRITLSLHAPNPVIPRITHPNCGVGRRGGNLPARAATPPPPSGTSGTPGRARSADIDWRVNERSHARSKPSQSIAVPARVPHSRGPVTNSNDDSPLTV